MNSPFFGIFIFTSGRNAGVLKGVSCPGAGIRETPATYRIGPTGR
jgi:hypothetical protein